LSFPCDLTNTLLRQKQAARGAKAFTIVDKAHKEIYEITSIIYNTNIFPRLLCTQRSPHYGLVLCRFNAF